MTPKSISELSLVEAIPLLVSNPNPQQFGASISSKGRAAAQN
jgi:hypothetical protein